MKMKDFARKELLKRKKASRRLRLRLKILPERRVFAVTRHIWGRKLLFTVTTLWPWFAR